VQLVDEHDHLPSGTRGRSETRQVLVEVVVVVVVVVVFVVVVFVVVVFVVVVVEVSLNIESAKKLAAPVGLSVMLCARLSVHFKDVVSLAPLTQE